MDDRGVVLANKDQPAGSTDDVLGSLLPGILCNDSILKLKDAQTEALAPSAEDDIELGLSASDSPAQAFAVTGNPTEACIMTLAANMLSATAVQRLLLKYPREDEIPFDSSTKYMATIHVISAKMCHLISNCASGGNTPAPTGGMMIIF